MPEALKFMHAEIEEATKKGLSFKKTTQSRTANYPLSLGWSVRTLNGVVLGSCIVGSPHQSREGSVRPLTHWSYWGRVKWEAYTKVGKLIIRPSTHWVWYDRAKWEALAKAAKQE